MKNKGKHMKQKRKFILTTRFYALMVILIGFLTIPILCALNYGDVTISIITITIGLLSYIDTFGEES